MALKLEKAKVHLKVHRLINDAQSQEMENKKIKSTHWDGWPVKK